MLPSYGGAPRISKKREKGAKSRSSARRKKGPVRASAAPALGAALTAALEDSRDKRVRYAAAECLAVINPQKRFSNHELVVSTLVDALGEYSYRVILIIEKDLQARNHLVRAVRDHLKMMPVVATSGYDGFSRIQAFPTEDLVIIATDLTKQDVMGPDPEDSDVYDKNLNLRREAMDWKAYEFIDRLHNSRRTAHVPVIVSAAEEDLYTIENLYVPDRARDAISKLVDPEELRRKVEKIFESDEARYQRDAKARKDRQAAIAATCFAKHIDLNNPNYQPYITKAIGPLTKAAHRPVFEVRIPALRGLGRIGRDGRFDADIRPIALPRLRELFGDKDVDYRVRAAAADAIGDIIQPSGRMDPSFYLILREGMADPHMEVRRAAAKAIGKANLPQIAKDDRTKVFFLHRVHKPVATAGGDD